MSKITWKVVLLSVCLLLLAVLLFYQRPVSSYKRVEIVDKFYTPNRKEVPVATGVKTKRKIKLAPTTTKPYCAMEFSNGKTLSMDCDTYLNYSIGENVKIKYRGNRLIDIRRKE
ncbi:hypothetical protein BpJC7_02020 [Weizmannia acidilactici]|uniref:DUF2500 domain-containing protein n=1 Tax=Weizmannia acidilactici TaxID=2607726 RepID=A0A5J4JCE4_9BACI|nr:hypothetical protein [Weizmannia acidilactici]GER66628.1 hypothetical protein BpJC4_10990 [Weizmannia acidilactici]GER68899.1 hypothetical protein BpJC7_02020 [Weizmannia acidilactici]GER73527.1 hypothetical protein BpPP18_15940 [Weizmannia acidilactici]